jgi:predicted amidophosphoribosyltransferase
MLIDDIYTTGATIDACSGALLRAGAKEVNFLTLAIGENTL